LSSSGTRWFCSAVPSTFTLTTAGNTFSSIGARLGRAVCPGTCAGSEAEAGKDAESDNPTLNAIALNSWFFFFIDADSRNLE